MLNANQIKTIFTAAVLGDALGVPVEFKARDSYQVTAMQGFGQWQQPAGTWSDDTSMSLCLVDSLAADGDVDDLMQRFVRYVRHAEYTPLGETFGVGRGTRQAIDRYKNKSNPMPAIQSGPATEMSNGNGALMRLAPLAIWFVQTDVNAARRLELTANYNRVTHGHPRSILASQIYIELLVGLLRGVPLLEQLALLKPQFNQHPEFKAFTRIFDVDFRQADRSAIKSSGYVVDTLEATIWCALNYSDYRAAVLAAVNLGDDADTVASITGSIKACQNPNLTLPDDWQVAIQNQKLLAAVFSGFTTKFAD